MVPTSIEERIEPPLGAALRHIIEGVADLERDLVLVNATWGGVACPEVTRASIKDDGELWIEGRPASWKAITKAPDEWTPATFTADVVDRGPLVIESGYSSAELVTDGVLERARVRAFVWNVRDASSSPLLWAAEMHFPGGKAPRSLQIPHANLFVRTPNSGARGWRFASATGQVFLLPFADRERWRIAFEVRGNQGSPDDEHVVRVLALLGFALGVPFRIGVLEAVSAQGLQGGLAELGLADHRPQAFPSHAEPVPRSPVSWFIDFVDLVFKYMARFPDAPFLVALHLFNAAFEGFVDTQFLQTFIAAETLATWAIGSKQLKTSGDIRIADKIAWKAWVMANAPTIRRMAVPGKEESLVGRVLSSEINSGTPVQKVFRGEGLGWTPEMEDAEDCRNSVAHQGMLGRHAWRGRNWSRDLKRVEFARFMFAALVAKLVGYEGPLADRRLPLADLSWWQVNASPPAEVWHVVDPDA